MTYPKAAWAAHDAILERSAVTDFTKAQDEIDARLAADAPQHPDSIELRRILQQSERSSEVATAMLLILELCLPAGINPSAARVAGLRVITILHLLQSSREGLGGASLATLARKLKCTRALLSHYARFWNKATGMRGRGQKLAGASEGYRASAVRSWQKGEGNPLKMRWITSTAARNFHKLKGIVMMMMSWIATALSRHGSGAAGRVATMPTLMQSATSGERHLVTLTR